MTSLATDPAFAALLTDSYRRLVGRPLLPADIPAADAARWLYEDAPFVVVSHNTDADPRFVYANRTAQRCFEYDWDEFVTLHSRLSAEQPNREERARLLDDVRTKGYSADYRGQRIAKSGRRFWIEKAVVWNLVDRDGTYRGQAATFADWVDA
ncbi:MEKHLA domain-containing protein [Paraburkholderia sp. SOS3]|jgi:PAS domain-containing protein|uniref:MEKHLA domain-containing protein n=1 Tax=Paraburkholderia sp. SOS3 TaxID=1926494 RepID=UPI0009475A16|nr:MEKHLA domain-containing protein [Paraburkholderia sp. SOS3]APR35997.1 MEKHLA domain-containing protein [Paraburkholderia sp. SOS3]